MSRILIIVDNENDTVTYGGREWTGTTLSRWYGGSSTWPTPAKGLNGSPRIPYGSLDFSFHGTAVAFYGNTPRIGSRNVTVSIDGGSSYNSSFLNPTSRSYLQWYQSPQLPEGNHTINLTNLADVSVDFIVVTAGPNTPLSGQTIIVDDNDPSIQYIGSWDRDRELFSPDSSTGNPSGFPFHNSTHRSLTEGDALTFEFTGTSISIFGIFDFSTIGNLSVIFDLDGQWTPLTYAVGPDTPEFKTKVGRRPNFSYFSQTSLAGGNHRLIINVTQPSNIPFIIDFLTYRPSSRISESNSETSPSPNSSSPPPVTSPPPVRSPSVVGPIVGSVVGTLALFLVAILAFCLYVRRRKKDTVIHLAGTRSSINPIPDWHHLHSIEVPPHARPPSPTTAPGASQSTEHRLVRRSPVPRAWPTPEEQQNRIRDIAAVIAELEQIRGEGGDLARYTSRIALLRTRLGSLMSRRAHSDTVALPPYRSDLLEPAPAQVTTTAARRELGSDLDASVPGLSQNHQIGF